jgi:hypothetical protein
MSNLSFWWKKLAIWRRIFILRLRKAAEFEIQFKGTDKMLL